MVGESCGFASLHAQQPGTFVGGLDGTNCFAPPSIGVVLCLHDQSAKTTMLICAPN